jgi:hypothetical protein
MSEWTLCERISGGAFLICFFSGPGVYFAGNTPAPTRGLFAIPNSITEGIIRISLLLLGIYGMYMFNKYSQSDGI